MAVIGYGKIMSNVEINWPQVLISISSLSITGIAVIIAILTITAYSYYKKQIEGKIKKITSNHFLQLVNRIEALEKNAKAEENDDRTV